MEKEKRHIFNDREEEQEGENKQIRYKTVQIARYVHYVFIHTFLLRIMSGCWSKPNY